MANMLFTTQCAECGKDVKVYGRTKDGTLPLAFCNKVCETNYNYKKRFDVRFK